MILAIAAVFILRLHGDSWRRPERLQQVMADQG